MRGIYPIKELRHQLGDCLQGRVCFMGLGNVDYGDDGFGVRLAEELINAGMRDVVVAETTPERYVGQVAASHFEHLIFLDAVEFDRTPGSVVFLNAKEITARFPQVSTHKISLAMLAEAAEAQGTRAWLLGVQPKSLKLGQQLTPTMQTTLVLLREMVLGAFLHLNQSETTHRPPIQCECLSSHGGAEGAGLSGSEVST